MGADQQLRNEYKATWEAFSQTLRTYQAYMELGDKARAESCLPEVEAARVAHNAARDRLAQHLTGRVRVRRLAKQLWENAGRPGGTAESDWNKAEQLVRSAAC